MAATSGRAGRVLGADGCPGGWVVAEVDEVDGVDGPPGALIRWHLAADAAGLLALADATGAAAVAVDVPIGLPEHGLRACDRVARTRLRGGGASSVFAAPPRRVLPCSSYAEARALVPSLSAQTWALVARIRDVDDALRGDDRHATVVECHPEVSLRELTGTVLPRKRSAPGALQRLAALRAVFGELPDDPPPEAALDDALDALVCAWTARRRLTGAALVLGGEVDGTGTPMRIVV